MKGEENLLNTLNEYILLGIREQLDYEKFYLYSIITHSTAIEGSTVTEIENQLLFDEGIAPRKTLAEQFMNLDLKTAYEKAFSLADKHTNVSKEMLCSLSAILMKNTGSEYNTIAGKFSSAKGELRLLNVSAGRGGKSYMAWQKVELKILEFCEWLNNERKKIDRENVSEIYRLSFEAHYRLVHIHPWADAFAPKAQMSIISNYANRALAMYGNGRMSRLLMNMIQKEFGVLPSIVKKEKRAEYIQSLALSQEKDDSKEFIDFMMNHHIENLKEQIKEYKASSGLVEKTETTQATTQDLSQQDMALVELIKANPGISKSQVAEEMGWKKDNAGYHIQKLKEKGIIKHIGTSQNGYWEVLKNEN